MTTPTKSESLGMTWWNNLSPLERDTALKAAATHFGRDPSVADAWEYWSRIQLKPTRGGPGRNQGRKKLNRPPSETPRPRPYKLTDAEVSAFAALAASRGITQAELLRRWIATAAPS